MNRWPFMPGNARRAVGICFEEDHLHWVEVEWPRLQLPRVVHQGQCARAAPWRRRDWQAHWRQAGVRAHRTGMALAEPMLMRLRVPLPTGLQHKERWHWVAQSLQSQLPWPIEDTAWDCQLHLQAGESEDDSTAQCVEVVATPKLEVRNNRQWCRRAGLRLTRLEPTSQALARAARWPQAWGDSSAALNTACNASCAHQVALGLALGAIQA
jgi:Tfp pilus assembly PilM family ATPase